MAVDGGTPRRLGDAQVLDTLSWSPDGSAIAFAAPTPNRPRLFQISAADGAVRPLATPGPADAPSWCPRDDLLAYIEPASDGGLLRFVDSAGKPVEPGPRVGEPQFLNGFLA